MIQSRHSWRTVSTQRWAKALAFGERIRCTLYNPGDVASARGPSARYLLGDDPDDVVPGLRERT